MCRRTDSGFTLLELLLSLAIMGIMLGLSLAFLRRDAPELKETAAALTAMLSRARADAMLARKKVAVELDGARICRKIAGGQPVQLGNIPDGIQLAFDGRELMLAGKEKIVFSPLGHTLERLVVLRGSGQAFSVYIPAVGAPYALPGIYSVQDIRKEKP